MKTEDEAANYELFRQFSAIITLYL